MTHAELHQIPHFAELLSDPRFRAAVAFLREHPGPKGNIAVADATGIIRSEGAWHGWFSALEALENLATAPQVKTALPKSAPYTTNQPPPQNA